MHTWKTHLRGVLFRLARTHGNNPIADIERMLCETFDGLSVRFTDQEECPLDPQMPLRHLVEHPFRCQVNIECVPHHTGGHHHGHHVDHHQPVISRFQPEVQLSAEERVPWFVREFARLEQTHDFMWAGYIVKEMLPSIGIQTAEAREFLDELQAQGIVTVRKIPNPRNPDHPASAVHLEREHEVVQQTLGPDEQGAFTHEEE